MRNRSVSFHAGYTSLLFQLMLNKSIHTEIFLQGTVVNWAAVSATTTPRDYLWAFSFQVTWWISQG